jgi:thiol-disulfide isomerase/thioredoxin
MSLERCPAVIVVLAMRGCGYCEEYKPRLEREIARWQGHGAPFVVGVKGGVYGPSQVPILFLDAESPDPDIQRLADEHQITGMPTTILFMRGMEPQKMEGALSDQEIWELLRVASRR